MGDKKSMEIQVAFAAEKRQKVLSVSVPMYTTAWQAVEQSGIMQHFPEFDFDDAAIGVYGKLIPRSHLLSNHDRVEIYRKLKQKPTTTRRNRAKRSARN